MKSFAKGIGIALGVAGMIVLGLGTLVGSLFVIATVGDWLSGFSAAHGAAATVALVVVVGAAMFGAGLLICHAAGALDDAPQS